MSFLVDAHLKQTINELKVTKLPLAYLVSIGGPNVKFKRIINTSNLIRVRTQFYP